MSTRYNITEVNHRWKKKNLKCQYFNAHQMNFTEIDHVLGIPVVMVWTSCRQTPFLLKRIWGLGLKVFLPGWPCLCLRFGPRRITQGIPLLTPNCGGNFFPLVAQWNIDFCRPTRFYSLYKEKVIHHTSSCWTNDPEYRAWLSIYTWGNTPSVWDTPLTHCVVLTTSNCHE